MDGNIPANTARFINHSCAPNCEIDILKRRIFIFALRDIEPGEELSYNYGEEYFEMQEAVAARNVLSRNPWDEPAWACQLRILPSR